MRGKLKVAHLRVVRHDAVSGFEKVMAAMGDEEVIQERTIVSVESGNQRHSSG